MTSESGYAPNFDLEGSVMLVTGPARGLGRASALACAAAGADVVLGLRDKASDGGLAAEIEKMGRKVLPLQLDVTKMGEIKDAVACVLERFGRIDILLNNVGVGPENPAEKVTEQDFDFTLNANLKGTFFVTQAVGRTMIERQNGRIINMSSQAGSVVLHGESIYCMTKAAINHLTRCLASEWAPYGITVNSIAPTFIYTDGTASALSDPDFKRRTLAQIPARPHWRSQGRGRRRGVPGLARRIAHYRHQPPGRRRMVGRRHEIGAVARRLGRPIVA